MKRDRRIDPRDLESHRALNSSLLPLGTLQLMQGPVADTGRGGGGGGGGQLGFAPRQIVIAKGRGALHVRAKTIK